MNKAIIYKKDQITHGITSEDLENQLKMAAVVQQDFLPKRMPEVKGIEFATIFEPLDSVSGDIFDIQRLDEKHIGFFIIDAVGHSMPAALLTMYLKEAIEMRETIGNTYRIFEPAKVLQSLNLKMISKNLSGSIFATAVYCLLNIETLELSLARAGHPYPVWIQKNGSIVNVESRGSLLGIFENALFSTQKIQLQEGDKILLYSDGAENLIGTFDDNNKLTFSDDLISASTYSAQGMCDYLKSSISEMPLEEEEKDDITAIVLEIS